MKYRIGLIDDEKSVIDTVSFLNAETNFVVNNKTVVIEIVEIELNSTIEDVIHEINSSDISALLVDFMLSNTRIDINFDGTQIINELEKCRQGFPSFILTALDAEAENSFVDVNKIYSKKQYLNEIAKPQDGCVLNRRIIRQIQNYELQIEKYKEEIIELKSKEILTLKDEERLIELDTFIEKSIDASAAIPLSLKIPETMNTLTQILESTNRILEEVKKNA